MAAEAEKLRASVEKLREINSSLVTEKDTVEVLLDIKRAESDSFQSANDVMTALVDEITGEVGEVTEIESESRSPNVELMARIAALESVFITNNE